jgi:hypothetical protein
VNEEKGPSRAMVLGPPEVQTVRRREAAALLQTTASTDDLAPDRGRSRRRHTGGRPSTQCFHAHAPPGPSVIALPDSNDARRSAPPLRVPQWGMAKEQRVFGAGEVAKQLGISGPGLRRLAVVYERVYGELPRDDRGRLWPEEALARLQAARAAVGEGRAASTEAALRAGDDGEVVVVDLDRRYPAPSKAADDRADALEKLLEELRLLRGAVEGMSRRLATMEIENRKLREAVSVSRELEAPSEPRESFETPEEEHTRLEERERTRELQWEERERTRELQWQLIEVREQLEAERSKGFWRRLFGG